jgi:hypothetical protein
MMNILLVVVITFSSSFIILSAVLLEFPEIFYESRIIENTQVILLSGGFLIFAGLSIKNKVSSGKILYFGLGIFYLNFCMRELEVENSGLWYAMILNPPVRNFWLVGAWVIALLLFIFNIKNTFKSFVIWIKLKQGVYFLTGGLFYLLGDIFDKDLIYINRDSNLFVEELFELNATIFMMLSAIFSLLWTRKQESRPGDILNRG